MVFSLSITLYKLSNKLYAGILNLSHYLIVTVTCLLIGDFLFEYVYTSLTVDLVSHIWLRLINCYVSLSVCMCLYMCVCRSEYIILFACVYHLFVRNNVGTIEYRSINKNKNKLSDWLTGTDCVNHSINITFGEPG